ncbi:MAG: substrate-binding domain-containing protein [Nitrososphaerales archaeon]
MQRRTYLMLATSFIIGAIAMSALNPLIQPAKSNKSLIVFAGAAAQPVYEETAKIFESKYNVKVELKLGGSGSVLSAMKITKIGDLFIPGSPEYLLEAARSNLVDLNTVKKLTYLVPAIIVQKGNPLNISSLEDLARPGLRVGIADPASVCVGLYAKELLEKNGLWEKVKNNIVVYAQSCDATASLIPTKAVDVVLGWHVFKDWYPDKAERIWITPSKITKIGYIAGGVSVFAVDKDLAMKFLEFLASKDAAPIWAKYGYFATEEEARQHAPNAVVEELVVG